MSTVHETETIKIIIAKVLDFEILNRFTFVFFIMNRIRIKMLNIRNNIKDFVQYFLFEILNLSRFFTDFVIFI